MSTATRVAFPGVLWVLVMAADPPEGFGFAPKPSQELFFAGHDHFPTYYGPEFTGRVLDQWAYERGVKLQFIEPGKPIQNALIESFNAACGRNV